MFVLGERRRSAAEGKRINPSHRWAQGNEMKLEQIFSLLRVSKNGTATTNSTASTGANLKSRTNIIPNCPPVGHRRSRHGRRGLILLAMLTLGVLATGSKALAQQLPFGSWSSATTYHTGDIIAKAGASATDLYKAVAASTNEWEREEARWDG